MSILLARLLKQSEACLAAGDAPGAETLCAQVMSGALALDNAFLLIQAATLLHRIPDCGTVERSEALAALVASGQARPLPDAVVTLLPDLFGLGAVETAEMLLQRGCPTEAALLLLSLPNPSQQESGAILRAATALAKIGGFRLATDLFKQLFTVNPTLWQAGWNAYCCQTDAGMVDGALDWLRRLDQPDNPMRPAIREAILYVAPLEPEASMALLHELAVSCQSALSEGTVPIVHASPGPERRRLRIGFLSRLFHLGNYVPIYIELFRNLDRARFEVVALFNGSAGTPMQRLRDSADETVDLSGLAPREAALRIRDARIDVLVDCNGFGEVEGNRILDWKPAPIQAVWSNKDCTSGMKTMDWVIADASLDGIDPAYFVERIYRLPCFQIDMPGTPPTDRPPPALRNGHVTIGAQIVRLKLNRAMLATWADILHRTPAARLLLRYGEHEDTRVLIRETMVRHGIAADRLDLRLATDYPTYVATYDEIDLVLDRFPLSGGVTTLEALWHGIPVSSWMGESWASRRGGTLLRQLGMPELVADSRDSYVTLVADLCSDVDRLESCRQTLRDRLTGMVFDRTLLARAMGDAFEYFWADYGKRQGAGVAGRAE